MSPAERRVSQVPDHGHESSATPYSRAMSLGERFPLPSVALAGLVACAAIVFASFVPAAVAAEEDYEPDAICVEWEGDEEEIPRGEGYCGADIGLSSDDESFEASPGKTFKVNVTVENFANLDAEDWSFRLTDGGLVDLVGLKSDTGGVTCSVSGGEGTCGSELLEAETSLQLTATYRARSAGNSSIKATLGHSEIDPEPDDNLVKWRVKVKPEAGKGTGKPNGPGAVAGCVVPKVKGLRLKLAKARLKRANCKPGAVVGGGKLKGRELNRLKVVASKPAAGKKLKRGARVKLVVKKRR